MAVANNERRRLAAEAGDYRLRPPKHRTRNRKFESISLHRRVRELSVPPETKSDQDAKPRHSIPRKRSLIKPTPSHATFCLGGGCGCEKSAAFVSVLDGDGHWVEYNDPLFATTPTRAASWSDASPAKAKEPPPGVWRWPWSDFKRSMLSFS